MNFRIKIIGLISLFQIYISEAKYLSPADRCASDLTLSRACNNCYSTINCDTGITTPCDSNEVCDINIIDGSCVIPTTSHPSLTCDKLAHSTPTKESLSIVRSPHEHNIATNHHNQLLPMAFRLGELEKQIKTLEYELPSLSQDIANDATEVCDFYSGTYLSSHCYSYESYLSGLTFDDAMQYCIYKGGHLAVPDFQLWNDPQFQTDFDAIFGSSLGPMWIGALVTIPGEIIGLDGTDLTGLADSSQAGRYSLVVINGLWLYSIDVVSTVKLPNYLCEYS